ncbi:MAG: enoyl-CoA hydratase/isomerase family protein [Candidatus Lokiarchaeota archaeon]|nr:enoyl-CoA hydratase/isomerase family protein [Candidatus Lokiarchaeota archaeon]
MLKFETIELISDKQNSLALIIFNRPERLNAFSYQLVGEVCGALEQISNDKAIKCAILTGKGKNFSVGGDINEFGSAEDPVEFMSKMASKLHEGIHALRDLEIPTIAAVNGACFGAALGYICACDLRMCTDSAKFGTAFTGIGLSTDSSTSFYLPKIVGLSLASEMIYLNRVLNSEEALNFGLVSSIFSSNEKFLEEIKLIGSQLSHGPIKAFKNVKILLNECYTNDLTVHLLKEAEKIKECAGTLDFKEGISAFLEKRKAIFKGK